MAGTFLKPVLLCFCLALAAAACAEGEHQRLAVEENNNGSVMVEGTANCSLIRWEDEQTLRISSGIAAEFLAHRRFSVGVNIPFVVFLPLMNSETAEAQAGHGARGAIGDPAMQAGYSMYSGNYRGSIMISYSLPLGISDRYHSLITGVQSGTGYHTVSLAFTGSRIVDPLITSLGISYSIGIPSKTAPGNGVKPGDINLTISITEAVNHETGLSFSLAQDLSLPQTAATHPNENLISYALSVGFTVLWNSKPWHVHNSIRYTVSDPLQSPTVTTKGGYTIDW